MPNGSMRLLSLCRRPPARRIPGLVGIGRDGTGWVRPFHTILDRDLPIPARVVRRLRLAAGDRVEFELGQRGNARRVAIYRRR
jgi:hypothetical protein